MAKMTIKIVNPVLTYFKDVKEANTNCESIFTFTIQSTPNANLEIVVTPARAEGNFPPAEVREVSVDLGSGYQVIPFVSNDVANYPYLTATNVYRKVVTINSTGVATMRLIMPNSGVRSYFPRSTVYIKDVTNGKETQRNFNRYNDSSRCITGEAPIAQDDSYNVVEKSVDNVLNISANDTQLSNLYDTTITVTQTPSKGAVTINNSNRTVKYTHTASDLVTDTFKYNIRNIKGISNEATVTVNIDAKGGQVITPTTNVIIYIDDTGSMAGSKAALHSMRDTLLKTRLLPYYNNDSALYESKVQVKLDKSEQTFKMLNDGGASMDDKTIVLVFQDEAFEPYMNINNVGEWTINEPRVSLYNSDITTLRNRMSAKAPGEYFGVLFQIDTPSSIDFQRMVTAFSTGQGNYKTPYGLEDKPEFKSKINIASTNTDQQFLDLVVGALNELGFNL